MEYGIGLQAVSPFYDELNHTEPLDSDTPPVPNPVCESSVHCSRKKDGDCNWPRCSDLRLTTDEPKSSRPDNTPWQPLTPVIPEFPHIQPEVPAKPEVAPQSTENQNDIPLPVSAPPEETGSNPAIVTASETQVKSNENVPATAAPLLSNDLVNLTLTAFLNTLRSEEESTS